MSLSSKKISKVALFLAFVFIIAYFVINSLDNTYRLPPKPDIRINDSTLLGVDTNDNGVRDDVERWIYQTYDTYIPCIKQDISVESSSGEFYTTTIKECNGEPVQYHQIIREIAMQYARAYQTILKNPENYEKNIELEDAAYYCNRYFTINMEDTNKSILIDHTIASKLKAVQLNTQSRIKAYEKYTKQLNGTIYEFEQGFYKKYCDFDVDTLLNN
ncbi:MAG: hypothetical protein LBL65_07715 [Campylobacteraceae bacterium]|jgi:hypothetical protein|nr:hypothetical protein [Campylobacteraceae bacterium]